MGYQELIESLRKEGDEKIQVIRKEAEAEAEQIKTETARKIELLRKDFRKKIEDASSVQERDIMSRAYNKSMAIRLSAEQSLSDRFFTFAGQLLRELRNGPYPDIFESLVNELPTTEWHKVKVCPEDAGMAKVHFPEVEIVTDAHIAGGVEVFRDKGDQHVINTFEKRLEKAWEEMLPLVMTDAYKEAGRNGIPSKHSG